MGHQDDGDKGKCHVSPNTMLHSWVGSIYRGRTKSRGRREELGRRRKEKKRMGCHREHPIQACAK